MRGHGEREPQMDADGRRCNVLARDGAFPSAFIRVHLRLLVPFAVSAVAVAGCRGGRPLEAGVPGLSLPRPVGPRLDRVVVGVAAGGAETVRKVLSEGITSKLTAAGITVRDLGRATDYDSPANAYGTSAGAEGLDMLVVLWGEVYQADRFGNFYSSGAGGRAKVLDAVEGVEFGARSVKTRGERQLTVIDAERSALETAEGALTGPLADEIARRAQTGGCAVRVTLSGIRSTEEVDRIRAYLRTRRGVIAAKSSSWSDITRSARFIVRIHPSTKGNLAAYLETVPGIPMKVADIRPRDVSGQRVVEK